jgi:hypothetical protein
MAAEITQIDTQDFTSQNYGSQDTNLLSTFNINTLLSTGSYIEYFTYDNNQNLLSTDYNFTQYTIQNDGQSAGNEGNINEIILDPEQSLLNNGFDQGEYITYFNFFNKQVGSELQQLYITEISSDRTEIRLDSTSLTNIDIIEQANKFIQERNESEYFIDFYLNFSENQLVIANNIQLDVLDPNNPTILIKLYEALPDQFDLNATLWVVTSVEESRAYQVVFEEPPIIINDTVNVKGPNFNLNLKDQVNNSTIELSYADILTTSLTSSQNQLNSLLEEKELDINVDYTSFENFIHFSSGQTRLENFYYKIQLIEQYSSSIAILNNTTNSSSSISSSAAVYESKINSIITNFDGYEYYLYYETGSTAWPKTNNQKPYILANSTNPTTLTWIGSTDETNAYYGGMLLSASIYDNDNANNLYFSIPEYLREDSTNDQYLLFVDMVGQFYDNIWIYYKDVTQKYNTDNRLEYGISKDIVVDAIRDFGVKLYQNNFSNEDLYTAFLGITPEGGLFPFPNITESLPTPSGFEYVDTLISASGDYLPLDDVNKSLYKRIYHNLPYLLKAKGTLPGLRALITSYGIPDTILRINEFGGKDKINSNDWDLWQDEFNYSFNTKGNNYVYSNWDVNPLWNSEDDVPSTIEFRFKTSDLPQNNIPLSQSIWSLSNTFISLRYEGTGYTSGSYSGSIIDPYYQYAYLDFYPDTNAPTQTASVHLPFYNNDWWSVMVTRNGNDFKLCVGNKIYEGGENNTELGFYSSSIISYNSTEWSNSGQNSNFGNPYTLLSNTYPNFSGSYQEIRYYSVPLSESVFKDYIMNPNSIEGNSLNSSPNELIFRASLGGELYTESISIHPKITGSWITTSSFVSDSNFNFDSTPTFIPNTEFFFADQPVAGIKNIIADKIRVEANVLPSGDTLSQYRALSQQANISQSYTPNINYLEVAFSPQNEINEDIMSQIGFFNIGEYIGDPRLRSSSSESYPALDQLRNEYFQKYTKNYNLVDFIRLIKFFDNSLFKMIKDFVPARTSLASGVVIKQHLLERNKYPQPQVSWEDLDISGTLKPTWNDYEEGTVEHFEGSTGGSFERFNLITNTSQSWIENINTISGSISIIHDSQDEFYNGELSGSNITITTQTLFPPLSIDLQFPTFNTTESISSTPSQGYIHWQSALNYNPSTGIYSLYIPSIYINETDINGSNVRNSLSNLNPNDKISFTISASVDDSFIIPFQITPTVTGIIDSIYYIGSSTWKINLSKVDNSQATYYSPIIDENNYSNTGSLKSNSQVILDPYLNTVPNFYNSDENALLNSVDEIRKNTFLQDVDYSSGITTPVNFAALISGSATKASIPDSNYTTKRHIIPRYLGSRSTSQQLNTWTLGDTGTYGKIPTIDSLKTYIAYSPSIGEWAPELMNASAVFVKYLIDQNGEASIPNTSLNSLSNIQQTFQAGERIKIATQTQSGGNSSEYRTILKGGARIEPILYTQMGYSPASWSNVTMSFTTDFIQDTTSTGNYTAYAKPSTSFNSFPDGNYSGLNMNNVIYTGSQASPWSGNSYVINSGSINENVSLVVKCKITPILRAQVFGGQLHFANIQLVLSRGGNIIQILASYSKSTNVPGYESPSDSSYPPFETTITLPPGNIQHGDQIYLRGFHSTSTYRDDLNPEMYFSNDAYLQISQTPVQTNTVVTSSGINTLWGYPDNTKLYAITASNQILTELYGGDFKQVDISGSGFNSISLPWSIKYGDEFRFEGNENNAFTVKKIYNVGDDDNERISQTGSIEVHFGENLPSSSINLDHFLIRRYIDDASQILIEGSKPTNTTGPYIISPEYVTPSLNKNIDIFITDLTQKGLL